MHFFSTVQYSPLLTDDSWSSYAEAAADFCRAPGRWVAIELWGGGKKIVISQVKSNCIEYAECGEAEGYKRAIRFIIGLATCLFGTLLALPLMAIAYTNEEIRLKHRALSLPPMSLQDYNRLSELVEERQRLAKERQGCDPIFTPCLLTSICCLLCCLVCCRSNK